MQFRLRRLCAALGVLDPVKRGRFLRAAAFRGCLWCRFTEKFAQSCYTADGVRSLSLTPPFDNPPTRIN